MAQAGSVEMRQPKSDYAAVNTTSSSGNTEDGTENRHHESGYEHTDGGTGDSSLRVIRQLPITRPSTLRCN